uniref:IBH1-like N-terminal domain-containing protein n=1 Tax=Leersia perrieri TaxID=77586 RepID=A0A0D9X5Y5_9ORYZ
MAMHDPRRFKKAFMERLLLSLQVAAGGESSSSNSKPMGLRERRDAVRLSSDVAMASARGPRAAPWARALVAHHAADPRNAPLLRRIIGAAAYHRAAAAGERSRRIVRRSQQSSRRKRIRSLAMSAASNVNGGASAAARRTVKGRMRVLRRLVPGGEALRGLSLLSETLDYVVCLKAQVELMQTLCKGSQQQLQLG